MELIGAAIKHKYFGEGIVKEYDERYVIVTFAKGDKKFKFPDAFADYLTIQDEELRHYVDSEMVEPARIDRIIREGYERSKRVREAFEILGGTNSDGQEDKIRRIAARRGIKNLVHFTRMENLNSILENGLVPVSIQEKRQMFSIHNDDQRMDLKTDCTSCSVTFPNYKLFYTFRENKYPGSSWVVISLKKDVLFTPSNKKYYCKSNAAASSIRNLGARDLSTADAFEGMFCQSAVMGNDRLIQRESLGLGSNMTTDPQAEILINGIIDKSYIDCIYFQNWSAVNEYTSKFGKTLLNQYGYQVEPNYFGKRADYTFWRKEC